MQRRIGIARSSTAYGGLATAGTPCTKSCHAISSCSSSTVVTRSYYQTSSSRDNRRRDTTRGSSGGGGGNSRQQDEGENTPWRDRRPKYEAGKHRYNKNSPISDVPWLEDSGITTYMDQAEKSMGRKELWAHTRKDGSSRSSSGGGVNASSSSASPSPPVAAGSGYSPAEQRRLVGLYAKYIKDLVEMHSKFHQRARIEKKKAQWQCDFGVQLITVAQEDPLAVCDQIIDRVQGGQEKYKLVLKKRDLTKQGIPYDKDGNPLEDVEESSSKEEGGSDISGSEKHQEEGEEGESGRDNLVNANNALTATSGAPGTGSQGLDHEQRHLDPNYQEMPFLRMKMAEDPEKLGEILREKALFEYGDDPLEGLSEPFYKGKEVAAAKELATGVGGGEGEELVKGDSSSFSSPSISSSVGDEWETNMSQVLGRASNDNEHLRKRHGRWAAKQHHQELLRAKSRANTPLKNILDEIRPSWDREGVHYYSSSSSNGGDGGRRSSSSSSSTSGGSFRVKKNSLRLQDHASNTISSTPNAARRGDTPSTSSSGGGVVRVDMQTEFDSLKEDPTTGAGGMMAGLTKKAKAAAAKEKIERLRRGEDPRGIHLDF